MTAPGMHTDASALSKEAGNFERIAGDLKGIINQVETSAGALQGHLRGQAGTATQQALLRFHEAATRQVQELNDISANIQSAGVHYDSTDADQAAALHHQML